MPQITVNSTNIANFGWSALFSPYGQTIKFDIAGLTTYNDASGTGQLYVLGVCFSVIDQQGVILLEPNWDAPQILPQDGETEYTLDLSSVGVDFFFQAYSIIGYIKDGNGQIYSTTQITPNICQPVGITQQGYVDGVFQVTANCPDNVLTVKEVTPFVYNNITPQEVSKSGTLYYPTGTISPVSFSGTPFTNNTIYNGQYRVACTTNATYSIGNDIYVLVTYYTNNTFDVTCANKLHDIICCIINLQKEKVANCNNSRGQRAEQLEAQITIPFLTALTKEISGQDASSEILFIKKTLNCNCGGSSIIRNEFSPLNNEPNPIDPTVTTLIITGAGATTVGTPTINGNTKTYTVKSPIYQVVKDNTLDNSFSITIDTSVLNTVKYKIAFNYTVLSQTILTTISGNNELLSFFNSLVNVTNFNVDLSNLDGKCIIDLSAINYFASYKAPSGATTLHSVSINGEISLASPEIQITDTDAIEAFLNSVGYGTFSVSYSTGVNGSYINILTVGNPNNVEYVVFNIQPTLVTVPFQKTSTSLIAFLQAMVDYICSLSALDIVLGQNQTISYIDYNGQVVSINLTANNTQADFNTAIQNVINTIQNLNIAFQNGITKTAGYAELGGTLVKNTNITLAGYTLSFGSTGNLLSFTDTAITSLKSEGTDGADRVMSVFENFDNASFLGSTVADRAAVSFYARSLIVAFTDSDERAIFSSHYPVTFNGSIPAPSLDPDKTVYVKASQEGTADTGLLELYSKTETHIGEIANFDSLLRVKRMTTAERDAIDVSLLTGGLIIFNTTTSKHQGYDGATWNNFY